MRLDKEDVMILTEGEVSIDMCYCVCGKCGARAIVPREIISGGIDDVDCITEGCYCTMRTYPAGKIKLSEWFNRDNLAMRVEETRDGFYISVCNK